MKIFVIGFILFVSTISFAQSSQEIFLQANKLYNEKQYDSAYHKYESLPNKGVAVWYNMGNCAYKQNNMDNAFLCWARAAKQANATERKMMESNCALVEKQLGVQLNPNTFFVALQNVVADYSLLFLQLLFIIIFGLCLFGGAYLYCKKQYFVCLLAFLCIFVSGSLLYVKYYTKQYATAYIQDNEVQLFTGPNNTYHTLASLALLDRVQVIEQRETWCKIKHKGLVGWAEIDKLAII